MNSLNSFLIDANGVYEFPDTGSGTLINASKPWDNKFNKPPPQQVILLWVISLVVTSKDLPSLLAAA